MLPSYQTGDQTLQLWQTKWAAELNPLFEIPILRGILHEGISLVNGTNVISHKLQRNPKGYILVSTTAAIALYNPLPFNNLTLTLVCNGDCTASLWIF